MYTYIYLLVHTYMYTCIYMKRTNTHMYTHTRQILTTPPFCAIELVLVKNPCTFCEGKETCWLCRLKSLDGSTASSLQTHIWIIWWYPICLKRVCCRRYLLPSSAALASYKGVEVGLRFFAQYCAIFAASLLSLHTAFSSNLEALVEPHSHFRKV